MAEFVPLGSDERILDTMIQLARATKAHRVIVAGSSAFDIYIGLLQRGFSRTVTTVTCRIPCGQHDVALVSGDHSVTALERLLARVVPFLNSRATLAVWVSAQEHGSGRKLQLLLERLGFRIEAGAKCENGVVLSAQRREWSQIAKAA